MSLLVFSPAAYKIMFLNSEMFDRISGRAAHLLSFGLKRMKIRTEKKMVMVTSKLLLLRIFNCQQQWPEEAKPAKKTQTRTYVLCNSLAKTQGQHN